MKGLILKDIINMKRNFKLFSVFVLIYILISFILESSSYFSSMFTLVLAMLTLTSYSLDEQAKWDGYALTMPISRNNIVQGKYLVMIILATAGLAFNCVVLTVLNVVMKAEKLYSGFEGGAIGAVLVILFYSIAMPFVTKFGVEKSRFIIILIYMIPFFIGNMVLKLVKEKYPESWAELVRISKIFIDYAPLIIPAVVLVALGISYSISVRIYRKKEF